MPVNNQVSDHELILLLQSGDGTALKEIYLKYWEPLYKSAFNFLKDNAACEDIIQEVFINIWNKRDTIVYTTSLKSYLYASTRYAVFRQIKAGNMRDCLFEEIAKQVESELYEHPLEHKELLNTINAIVEQLPEKCKEVYKLSRVEQLSHKEIAAKLNISTKTVENHLTKALRILRNSLGDALIFTIISQFVV